MSVHQLLADVDVPSYYHLEYEDLPVRTSDGVTLSCYLLRYSVQRRSMRGLDVSEGEAVSRICAGLCKPLCFPPVPLGSRNRHHVSW